MVHFGLCFVDAKQAPVSLVYPGWLEAVACTLLTNSNIDFINGTETEKLYIHIYSTYP